MPPAMFSTYIFLPPPDWTMPNKYHKVKKLLPFMGENAWSKWYFLKM